MSDKADVSTHHGHGDCRDGEHKLLDHCVRGDPDAIGQGHSPLCRGTICMLQGSNGSGFQQKSPHHATRLVRSKLLDLLVLQLL